MLSIRGKASSTLVISMTGHTTGNGKWSASVDIGADNKIEFTQALNNKVVRKAFKIQGAAPLLVRITVDGSASWAALWE